MKPRTKADRRKAWMDLPKIYQRKDDDKKIERRYKTVVAAHFTVFAVATTVLISWILPGIPGPDFWKGLAAVLHSLSGISR